MRTRFDEELSLLSSELIEMGAMCEEALSNSVKALLDGDVELAKKVIPADGEIDNAKRDIESLCLKMLIQQQPVAHDLKLISAALKMITDMERIGDQAVDIAEIVISLNGRSGGCEYVGELAYSTIKMVTESINALVRRDVKTSQKVIESDSVVDSLFDKVKNTLIKRISEKPEDGEYAVDLFMVSKYFERIGDHAVNVAEWVISSEQKEG